MGRPTLPIEAPSPDELARFWRRVETTAGASACWPWSGGRNSQGYGIVKFGGRHRNASRVSWFIANGPIPDGHYILHHCDHTECVNPRHLFAGTQRENVADMDRKGRRGRGRKVTPLRAEQRSEQIAAVRALRAAGWARRRIGALLGLSRVYVEQAEQVENREG